MTSRHSEWLLSPMTPAEARRARSKILCCAPHPVQNKMGRKRAHNFDERLRNEVSAATPWGQDSVASPGGGPARPAPLSSIF